MGRNMKRTKFSLTCLLLLVAAKGASAQDDAATVPVEIPAIETEPLGAVGIVELVGDWELDSFVGDEDGLLGEELIGDESADAELVGDDVVGQLSDEASVVEPTPDSSTGLSPLPMTRTLSRSHISETPCDTTIFSSAACGPQNWFSAEALLWFPQDRKTPPLVEVGPVGAEVNQFGNPIDSGIAPGFRFDFGRYFNGGKLGIGGRFWAILGEEEDYSVSSNDPTVGIVRPFFNTNGIGGPAFDQLIVSGLGPTIGGFSAQSEFDLIAAEAYGKILFDRTSNYRIDLIGGFSHFGIDDSLALTSNSLQAGTQSTFNDLFDAENRFYGGQLGLETEIQKGRWSLRSLSKVHLGNMNQQVSIQGSSRSGLIPDPPGPGTDFTNGFFVQGQQGEYEQDEFTFAPELNLKLGYSIRSNIEFTVGYSFVYWSSVALAGEQITPIMDGTLLLSNTPGAQAAGYGIVDDGFWMQGIDLGLRIDF